MTESVVYLTIDIQLEFNPPIQKLKKYQVKKHSSKQTELIFKPTEHQLDLVIGKSIDSNLKHQFFKSKKCQLAPKLESDVVSEDITHDSST